MAQCSGMCSTIQSEMQNNNNNFIQKIQKCMWADDQKLIILLEWSYQKVFVTQ